MAEIETEQEMSRAEVAAYFHEFADKLSGERTQEEESTTDETDSDEAFVSNESDTHGKTPQGEHGGKVTFTAGNESATVNPPDTVLFEIEVDSTSGMLESSANETIEFTLNWETEESEDDEDDELDIQ